MNSKLKATEPDGFSQHKIDEDDDVEGHGGRLKATEPDGFSQRKIDEDDDVEGHMFNMKSPSSRGE